MGGAWPPRSPSTTAAGSGTWDKEAMVQETGDAVEGHKGGPKGACMTQGPP